MENLQNKMGNWIFPTILIYTTYLSVMLFKGWISKLNYYEMSSVLTPGLSGFSFPTIFTFFRINLFFDPILANYILLLITSVLSLYIMKMHRAIFISPFLMLSIYLGDYVSPIILSLLIVIKNPKLRSILFTLLAIHDPLYLIPIITLKPRKKKIITLSYTIVLIILLSIYRSRYLDYIVQIYSDVGILLPILLIIVYSFAVFKVNGIYSLPILFSPYASLTQAISIMWSEEEPDYRGIDLLTTSSVMLLLLVTLFIPNSLNITLNGSLDNFLLNHVDDSSVVLSLSGDNYVNSLLTSKGIYTVRYGDSLYWNWSDRDEIEEKLFKALEYAENHGIKYIIIDKPEELAFWVSPKHYNEYKYPLREPLGRYIIVLERIGFIETAEDGFYLKDFDADARLSLSREFTRYWSNITLDIEISNESILIYGNDAYEVYLHFDVKNVTGYYLFKLEGADDYFRSIEFYVYDGTLKSLWETSRKRIYNPIMVWIESTVRGDLVFKIEDDNPVKLYLYRLDSPDIFHTFRMGREIGVTGGNPYLRGLISDFKDSITLNFSYGEVSKARLYSYPYPNGGETAFLIITGILLLVLLYKEVYRDQLMIEYLRIPSSYAYLYLISLPIILYLIHPRLINISWIGGGVFLIAFSMGVFTFLIDSGNIDFNRLMNVLLMVPLIVSTAFITKYFYGDVFDLVGDFWRNQSLYASIDVAIYGVSGLLASIYLFGRKNIHFHIPFAYLIVSGTSFITDLLKISNPILQGMIDLATYLVDLSMEVVGYRIEYVTVPAGNALYVYDDKLLTVVILGWPCTGVTGIFIFLSFLAVLNIYFKTRFGYSIPKTLILTGLLITYILNIVRIDLILYLDILYVINASELFHSIGYEMVFLIWIAIYFLIVYRHSRRSL